MPKNFWAAVLFLTILGVFLALGGVSHGVAQTATPEPTLVAMQQQLDALSTQTSLLQDQAEIDRKAVDLKMQQLELQAEKKLMPLTIGAIILALLGVSSVFPLYRYWQTQTRKMLDDAIYRVNAVYLPIYYPAQGFERELKRLSWVGFKNLIAYTGWPGDQPHGVVIFPARSIEDVETLERFIQTSGLEPKRTAIILYTLGHIPGADKKLNEMYDNATLANSSVTIVTHIYALARGLRSD